MATTTEAAIRDRLIRVIETLVPRVQSGLKFLAHRDELDADFVEWAEKNPRCTRRFQVIYTGDDQGVAVSDAVVELRRLDVIVVVAYGKDHRFGIAAARARHDAMRADQHQIEDAIGLLGRANFTPPDYPDACWLSGSSSRETGKACDFLVVRQTMQFYRAVT